MEKETFVSIEKKKCRSRTQRRTTEPPSAKSPSRIIGRGLCVGQQGLLEGARSLPPCCLQTPLPPKGLCRATRLEPHLQLLVPLHSYWLLWGRCVESSRSSRDAICPLFQIEAWKNPLRLARHRPQVDYCGRTPWQPWLKATA